MESTIDIPHQLPAQPSTWQKYLAGAMILAGLTCAIGGVSINMFDRNFRPSLSMPTAQEMQAEFYQEFDHNMDLAKSHSRGVFMRFANFDENSSQLALNAYFRAVYDLYPIPVRVGDLDVPMNTAPQVMDANSKPDNNWMRNHGLDAELVVTLSPPLTFYMRLRPLDGQPPIDLPKITFRPMVLPPSLRVR